MMKIHDDPTYGTRGIEQITVQPDPNEPRRQATVTFSTTAGLSYSTNNVAGDPVSGAPVSGWRGASVPGGLIRLLATGTSRGVTRTVEVVLIVSAYPYAIACDGPLQADGSLVVMGARCLSDFVVQPYAPKRTGLQEGWARGA